MRVLVTLASLVIIAGGGYFGWREWDHAQCRAEAGKLYRPEMAPDTSAKVEACLLRGSITREEVEAVLPDFS